MEHARRHAVRRVGRATALAAAIGGGLALGAAAAAAVTTAVFARTVVTPPTGYVDDTRVLAIDRDSSPATITLSATADARLPGRYSLWFDADSGLATVGPIVEQTPSRVVRELIDERHGRLRRGVRARISGWIHSTPRDIGSTFESVRVPTQYGLSPAWLFAADAAAETGPRTPSGRWAIHVHGRATRRQETLRGIPAFTDAGFTSLVVSYRNDGDAPQSPDFAYALGGTEWRDVDDAISFAVGRGASEIVLVGWSMGGAICLQTATRSRHRDLISGLVLESPVVDWATTLRYQSELVRLPRWTGEAVITVLQRPWITGITGQSAALDIPSFDFVARAGELSVPVLLMHSDDDGFVPAGPSRALAEARPDIVTFERFDTARHTKLWNYDPVRWEGAIRRWLAALPTSVARPDGELHPDIGGLR